MPQHQFRFATAAAPWYAMTPPLRPPIQQRGVQLAVTAANGVEYTYARGPCVPGRKHITENGGEGKSISAPAAEPMGGSEKTPTGFHASWGIECRLVSFAKKSPHSVTDEYVF